MGASPSNFYAAPSSSSSLGSTSRRRYTKEPYHDYHSTDTLPSDRVSTPTESLHSAGKQEEYLRHDDQKHIESNSSGARSRQDPLSPLSKNVQPDKGPHLKDHEKEPREPKTQDAPKAQKVQKEANGSIAENGDAEQNGSKVNSTKDVVVDVKESTQKEPERNGDALPEAPLPENGTLPLLFQLSMDEFIADHELTTAFNRKLVATKSAGFDKFLASENRNYAINSHGLEYVQDHKSGAQYYKRIFQSSGSDSSETNHDLNETTSPASTSAVSASSAAPLAWLAVLLASGAKPKKQGAEATGNGALANNVSATKSPQSANASIEPMDAPQTLGLLMMQYLYDPAFKHERYDILSQKPRGLTNSGNICYMNVVLQCLIFCEPFTSLFHLTESKSIGNIGADSPTPLIDATIHFLRDYTTIPPLKNPGSSFNSEGIVVGKPLSPETFYQKLIENPKFQHLSWGQQEDAEEFLGYFLDGLHEEFVKVEASVPVDQMERIADSFSRKADVLLAASLKASILKAARLVRSSGSEHIEESEVVNDMESTNDWAEVGSGRRVCKKRIVEVEPSPITRMFGGRFRSVLTVPKSKEQQSITLDPFRCILLDITLEDVQKVEDALWKFNEIEKLPYKVDVGKEVVARKQTFIDELPEVMILHLKRFSYQNDAAHQFGSGAENNGLAPELLTYGTIEKVMKNILYGLNLVVPPESLSAPLRRENQNNYSLTAVIYHHGRNAEGGHYTCDVMRPGKRWLRIDDTAVEAIDAEDVLDMSERDKSAYILMYQRKS